MNKVTSALPANRVAALAAFITGLASAATALAGAWPSATTNNIAVIGGGVLTLAGPLAHIVGSWLWDKRTTSVKLKEMELELENLYHDQKYPGTTTQSSTEPDLEFPNVTDVADVADDTEAPDEIDPEEAAEPEHLDENQWLMNRKSGQPGPGNEEKAPEDTTTPAPGSTA